MPETITPSRLGKTGDLWMDKAKRPFAEAVAAAIGLYRVRFLVWPVSCYCGSEIPADFVADGVPVYHADSISPHYFWLEHPEGLDWRKGHNDQ